MSFTYKDNIPGVKFIQDSVEISNMINDAIAIHHYNIRIVDLSFNERQCFSIKSWYDEKDVYYVACILIDNDIVKALLIQIDENIQHQPAETGRVELSDLFILYFNESLNSWFKKHGIYTTGTDVFFKFQTFIPQLCSIYI